MTKIEIAVILVGCLFILVPTFVAVIHIRNHRALQRVHRRLRDEYQSEIAHNKKLTRMYSDLSERNVDKFNRIQTAIKCETSNPNGTVRKMVRILRGKDEK